MIAAAAGDSMLEPAAAKLASVLVVVIAAVGDHPLWPPARSPALASDRLNPVDEWQQLGDIVAVPAGQRDRQRNPASIDMQMML